MSPRYGRAKADSLRAMLERKRARLAAELREAFDPPAGAPAVVLPAELTDDDADTFARGWAARNRGESRRACPWVATVGEEVSGMRRANRKRLELWHRGWIACGIARAEAAGRAAAPANVDGPGSHPEALELLARVEARLGRASA